MRRIHVIRTLNGVILIAGLSSAIMTGLHGDGINRYWEGKALGGALAIIGIMLLAFAIIAVNVFKETKSVKDVYKAIIDMLLIFVSYDWPKALVRPRKK